MTTFHYIWEWKLQSSPAALWPLVTNTDRFNGASGIPPITYTETPLPEGGTRRTMFQRVYGVLITYDEDPFEWVYEQRLARCSSYRPAVLNPLKEFRVLLTLRPLADGGTHLIYETWTTASNPLGLVAIPVQINGLYRRRFARVFREMDAYAQKRREMPPFPPTRSALTTIGRARVLEASAQMNAAKQDPTIIAHLVNLLQKAPDAQLVRMRPFALADAWGVERHAALEVFLRSTRLGLLDLSWDMICPECRGAKHQSASLSGVTRYGHCPSCNIDFEVDFGKTVEATFQVNKAIRPVERIEFCVGNPQNSPHILIQQRLQPGESRTFKAFLEPGRYRWLAPGIAAHDQTPRSPESIQKALAGQAQLIIKRGAPLRNVTIIVDAELTLLGDVLAPGEIAFTLTNETQTVQQVSLGRLDYAEKAVTATEITSMQVFRDLFSSEALRPGETISVENLTFLFTDLKGSTSMYRLWGDAPVFKRVMDHFDVLKEGVKANQGALVKTIGDAIMAVFTDPADAVRAALHIRDAMETYNQREGTGLTLKMGINTGACIAVTLNDRLDYFGSVVNLAARLEGLSYGNDIIVAESVAEDPGVLELIVTRDVPFEKFDAAIKGYSEAVPVRRLMKATEPINS